MGRTVGSKNKIKEEIEEEETMSEIKEAIVPYGTKTSRELRELDEISYLGDEVDGRRYLKSTHEPICFNCNHRESMHHIWKLVQVAETYKDGLGHENQRIVVQRNPDYSEKPCQHACKCTSYK